MTVSPIHSFLPARGGGVSIFTVSFLTMLRSIPIFYLDDDLFQHMSDEVENYGQVSFKNFMSLSFGAADPYNKASNSEESEISTPGPT